MYNISFSGDIRQDGKFTVHFDGWTNRYDYVTTMNDPELHPVGWFAQKGKLYSKLNQVLQQPKGWN